MSEDNKSETTEPSASNNANNDPGSERSSAGSSSSGPKFNEGSGSGGPKFNEGSDPLAGVKKSASEAMANMEGKTVSMKTYVGTIIGVIVLMMLARCG